TITGVNAIALLGGASGGQEGPDTTSSFGNYVQIRGNGSQEITVGAGGITLTGGSGITDNFAQLRQAPSTGSPGAGAHQTVTVTNGGGITLQGGSTSAMITAAGNGAFARIRGEGGPQTINFTGGGNISIMGGSVGSGNAAEIRTDTGAQTISGAPNVTMVAG